MISDDRTPTRGTGLPDEVFDLLSHEYCRRVLAALIDDSRAERGVSSDWVVDEADDGNLLETGRYYNHLSRLAAIGVIHWDQSTDTITRGPQFDELSQLLTCTDGRRAGTASDTPTASSLEMVFDALRHPFRRHVLLALTDPPSQSTDESSSSRFRTDCDDPDVLEIELRRVHFDTLDEYGFVDWDPETDSLARGENFDEIAPLLAVVREKRHETSEGS
jgi:hypothetical protein